LPDESPAPGSPEAPQQRVRLAEERLAEVLAAYRTLKTENDGYRDRIARNLERRYEQRREKLLLRFIEILDNLDRALEAAEQSYLGNSVVDGLLLVRTQLLQALQEEGLERIPVVGLPYDPAVSEAVGTEAVGDPDQHHVVLRDLLRGYRLNGRVARASKVLVGEYREGESAQAPAADGHRIGTGSTAPPAREAPPPAPAATAESPAERPTGEQAEREPAAATEAAAEPPVATATEAVRDPSTGQRKKEITFSKLTLDIDAAVHAAAEAATEIEDDDSFAEIVAATDEEAEGATHEDDGKKDGD